MRGEARHLLYSKVMCWVALDRAVSLDARFGAENRIEEWTGAKDKIFTTVVRDGWSEDAGVFTQHFGSADWTPPASCCPSSGFSPWQTRG